MAEPGPAAPAVVAASEAELVGLTRALLAGRPADVAARVFRGRPMAPAISEACERMLGDALAKLWPAVWRRGGTQPVASVDAAGVVRHGRAWERHAPIGLRCSVATPQLLRWMLSSRLVDPRPTYAPWTLTVGDQLIAYLALDATAGSPAQARIAAHPIAQAAALAWLGFADVLAEVPSVAAPGDAASYASLCHGAGALIVEALTGELARRWRVVELGKRGLTAPEPLIALGAAQDAVLGGFLAACDERQRRDLAGFVIDAAAPLLARALAPAPLALVSTASLASRAAARRAAGALLRGVMRWAAWDEAHRGVRFLDDDYAATQRLLARFEAIQAAGAARAAAWLADLASLVSPVSPVSTTGADAAGKLDGP